MAEMAGEGSHTETLRQVGTDYGGVFSAALNLSVRCSATAIDLCAAALGRLVGIPTDPSREMDAGDFKRRISRNLVEPLLASTTASFESRLSSTDFVKLETLRHQLTHKRYRRGVYGTTESPAEPARLAFPRQMDIELGGVLTPKDEAARWCVQFGETTFRDLCGHVAEIGDP